MECLFIKSKKIIIVLHLRKKFNRPRWKHDVSETHKLFVLPLVPNMHRSLNSPLMVATYPIRLLWYFYPLC